MGPRVSAATANRRPHLGKRRNLVLRSFHSCSVGNDAILHVAPQGDEQLARQGHYHDFLDPPSHCADTCAEPHGQGAVRLPAQPRPGEFDHCRAHASVAVFSDPLFTFAATAREWRSAEPDISAERASITKLPYERLTHEKCGEVRTDRPQVRQRADHPFRFVCRRVLLENGITRRLHLFNQLQNEIKTIEQTFDARSRLLRNGLAVRLAQGSQLLAATSPQSLVSFYAQCRQNAVDLVDDRSPLPGQILPFSIRTPRFHLFLDRDLNTRTDPRLAP